ncbi:DUF3604 domain-containing protein [Rhodoplanes roseus]|uniref:DUF3604 domain-containing protein n=1 Tax=Rhodoplanes roseus TaxID=29409 RepID=A0A327L2N9_9BRAD|nr:DUF3604 domain-containing protein [Rhodoplanes roseus]RAI44751.1 hypothetical protein CH341_07605 [Rhodoplanes roseus]
MPHANYLPEQMGSATLVPAGPFTAGSYAALTLTYTAGPFGVDDTGMLKITWRTTSDMGKPQFKDPKAPNYTTVEASNGAALEVRLDRVNIRPWANTLVIRVGRGFLREGDTLTVRLGDTRQGSPGLRLQTNCEDAFEFKMFVDAFATYEFTELASSPRFALMPGAPARWKAILPSLAVVGEPFRLAVLAEDVWGNPTDKADARIALSSSQPLQGLPDHIDVAPGDGPHVIEGIIATAPGDVGLRLSSGDGETLADANPMKVVAAAPLRRYWADLHGQSGETVGTGPAEAYFAYARDKAFVDMVGHQGNDFQITDAFWAELNRLTASFDVPGRFVCLPGYEWSGNTGLGGDRNVFYRHEGRPIRRSSRILVDHADRDGSDCHTAHDLFAALAGEDAVVIAHVGGRYADIGYAHDGRIERAVEVHSTWGTFEWLLHDAFDRGYRVGVVCHSDDHKGRPGATRPGASTFGAIGGLSCYLMPELTRDALFAALRARHHYGTTGTRLFLDVRGSFDAPVTVLDDDPALGPAGERSAREVLMGDIVRPGVVPMRLAVEAIGTAPIERVDVFHGKEPVRAVRPFAASALGRRVRVLWQGAEYRGRGREVVWQGKLAVSGNRIARFAPVNFLNPERQVRETAPGAALAWSSVTTGNLAGIDLWLDEPDRGTLSIETNVVGGTVDLAGLADGTAAFEGGGLGRRVSLYRLPEQDWERRLAFTHEAAFAGGADLPVYVRVTQADGHQAWSSPIYLIG